MFTRDKCGESGDENLVIVFRYCFDPAPTPSCPPVWMFSDYLMRLWLFWLPFSFISLKVGLFLLIPYHLLNNTSILFISLFRRNNKVRYVMENISTYHICLPSQSSPFLPSVVENIWGLGFAHLEKKDYQYFFLSDYFTQGHPGGIWHPSPFYQLHLDLPRLPICHS